MFSLRCLQIENYTDNREYSRLLTCSTTKSLELENWSAAGYWWRSVITSSSLSSSAQLRDFIIYWEEIFIKISEDIRNIHVNALIYSLSCGYTTPICFLEDSIILAIVRVSSSDRRLLSLSPFSKHCLTCSALNKQILNHRNFIREDDFWKIYLPSKVCTVDKVERMFWSSWQRKLLTSSITVDQL